MFLYNYISGYTNYTNLFITGKITTSSTSSYSTYYQGGLEASVEYGSGRNINNVTLDDL